MYSHYHRYPFFERRSGLIRALNPAGKVLVAGCGWGYLIDELIRVGIDAWGIDASTYALERAKQEVGSVSHRLLLGDCGDPIAVDRAAVLAGLSAGEQFEIGVTEDMLPVLDNEEECSRVLMALRARCAKLIHIVTCIDLDDPAQAAICKAGLLWKSAAGWQHLVGSADVVIDTREES